MKTNWPKVWLGEVLRRNQNAEGVPEISRRLRSTATIPPDRRPHLSCTLKGCGNGSHVLRRTIPAPRQGAARFSFVVRGYRCAQPPANFRHPVGMLRTEAGA